MTVTEIISELHQCRSKLSAKLDEAGVGHDIAERITGQMEEIGGLVAQVHNRACGQATWNLIHNVPTGILTLAQANAKAAFLSGTVSALGEILEWNINATISFCADLLDDVNAHTEADELRAMAIQ